MAQSAGSVYFAHGKESGPWGDKIRVLAKVAEARGWVVASPNYQGMDDPQQRIEHLLSHAPGQQPGPLVLVGSSMGGYVSAFACAELQPAALLLLAPAVYMPGYADDPPLANVPTTIVHGWQDEVIPVENAIRLARRWQAELHLLQADHRLMTVLPELEHQFARLLQRVEAESVA